MAAALGLRGGLKGLLAPPTLAPQD